MNNRTHSKILPAVLAVLLAGSTATGLAAGASVAALTSRASASVQPATAQVVPVDTSAVSAPSVAVAPSSAGSVADTLQADIEAVYARANPSVVYIVVSAGNGFNSSQASGSGFVYDQNGMIVTNDHVVQGADQIEVIFADGSHQAANLVGADAANDLAVLQVSSLPASAVPLALAPDDSLQVGEFVTAIGSPFGEQNSMSFGIVSGLDRTMQSSSTGRNGRSSLGSALDNLIQTDAPINPGNSGGPLLNLDGQVVGVNNAIESTSGSGAGVGFAIPASVVRSVVPGIIANAG
jgi:S1-C subfamily serine protease